MGEWRNGGMEEWGNGGMEESRLNRGNAERRGKGGWRSGDGGMETVVGRGGGRGMEATQEGSGMSHRLPPATSHQE